MPKLLKILAQNLAMGIIVGWVTLALLIYTNAGGLYDVVSGSSNPLLPIALLAFGFAITFGSLSMGAAIMLLPYDDDEKKNKGLKIHTLLASLKKWFPQLGENHRLIPVPVKDKSQHSRYHR